MKATVAYLRVSSDRQDTERQKQSVGKAAENLAVDIAMLFEDSLGRNPRDQAHKRPDFQRMLKLVQDGKIGRIIVDAQDRFGTKDAYEWGQFISLLRRHDCELIDSQGKCLSGDDDVSVLTGTLGAITSRREQKEKAHRNVSGKIPLARAGEYQGGYPPHGFDVVCFGPDGKEKWRTVYYGKFKRQKVYPDGSRETFDGIGNSPKRDLNDTLRYRPSIERDRIETAKQIFKWYATESISPGDIADRLSDLGIKPVFAERWYSVSIGQILKNPIYIGLPTWNKRGSGRFVEFSGGRLRDVGETNGKAKAARPRAKEDYVQPSEPEFAPLVSGNVWATVQSKIKEASGKFLAVPKRAPYTADLWLRPFVFCGHCGRPMHATRGESTARLEPSYFCGTYNRYGKNNPAGCRCHRVNHDLLVRYVEQYLKEVNPKVAALVASVDSGSVEPPDALIRQLNEQQLAFGKVIDGIYRTLVDNGASGGPMIESYGAIYEQVRPQLEQAIAEKESELEAMLDDYRGLSEGLRARANARMEKLQCEIDDLNKRLVDLRIPIRHLKDELKARREAIAKAIKTVKGDSDGRRKAEAIRTVIDRMVCRFRHTNKDGKPGKKSFLESVEVEPVSGQSLCFSLETSLGPD